MVKIESGKPLCPICGAEAYRGHITWRRDLLEGEKLTATQVNIQCTRCGIEITLDGYDVIGKWNMHLKQEVTE